MMELKIAPIDGDAAKHAVMNWHYSKCMPSGKAIRFGVWEDSKFIGAVMFGRGACRSLMKPYGLTQMQGCELTRIALRAHQTPVTKIVSIATKMLRKTNPGLRLIVSFTDDRQGHLGVIYQAGNWVFTGKVHSTDNFFFEGRWRHMRTIGGRFGTIKGIKLPRQDGGYRYRYLMPLDDVMREQVEKLRQKPPRASGETLSQSPSGDSSRFNSEARAPILQTAHAS